MDLGAKGQKKMNSLLCQAVIRFDIQEILCNQDAPEKEMTPTTLQRRAEPDSSLKSVTGRGTRSTFTEMIKTCKKKCWEFKVPKLFSAYVGGLRAPWLNISHGPEHNPDHSFAAVWLDSGSRGEAGEVFLDMRGSSSFRGMEGFKERRGEHSFKALWRLAAVGRAAVFPKSPPNRKTVCFFSIAQEKPLPHSQKARTCFELTGGKKNQNHFIKCLEYSHGCVHYT